MKYTGINRIFKINSLQQYIDKIRDGTFAEFWDDWKWIFSYSLRYKWIVLFYTILGIISATLGLGSAYISRTLINIITTKDRSRLGLLIGCMAGAMLANLVFTNVMSRVNARINIYVNNAIQGEIFDKIIDSKWSEINRFQNGDLLNRFNGDVSTIAGNAVCWIPNLVINIYTFALTFVVMIRLDVIMAFIALMSAPVLVLMSHYIMRRMKAYRKRVLEMNSQMMSFEVEAFYNFDSIKSFGVTQYYSKGLRRWQKKYKEYNLDYNTFEIKTNILMTLLSTTVSMVSFGYCLFRMWTGQILYGDMTFFLQQSGSLAGRFKTLVGTIPGMLNSSVSAHRIRELVDLDKEAHDPASLEMVSKLADQGLSLRMTDVTFSYVEDNTVYENASLEAKPGEMIAVLGESGGGKTTMFRLLLGLVQPESGSVVLQMADGTSVDMNTDLRELISYVPQGNSAIMGTIAENLRMVKEDATEEELVAALKIAHAWEFVEPMGIDAGLGERGKGISEGQAQRLAIARAMLRNAPILFLDEATSALDEATEELVLDSIMEHCPNKTIIVSTHRPSVLSRCKRVYRIEGKKIERV